MRDMYSTVIDIHRLRQKEQRQHHLTSYAREAADLRRASNSLLAFSSRPGSCTAGGSTEEEEVLLGDEEVRREQARLDCSFVGLLAPLYRPGLGLAGGGERGGHHTRSIVSSSISAFTLPVIKLNNCVIDEPEMEAITEEDNRSQPLSSMESLVLPVASVAKASKPPGLQRSNSASSSSMSSSSLSPAPSSTSGCWLSPGAARSDFGSNSSLHVLSSHSKSLDLEGPSMLSVRPERRKHPSWPRLDRSNSSKGYVRLENREERPAAAARRDFSKREKLLMISRSHNNLSFEHDEFSSCTLKRGSSESRF